MPTVEKKVCAVPGCERPARSRGWCILHYNRWLRHGTIELPGRGLLIIARGGPRTYKGMHNALSHTRGPASDFPCIDCENVAQHWSYNYLCDDERKSEFGPWCLHFEHYDPRCIPCHTSQAIPRGESHYRARLAEDDVRAIRRRVASGETQRALALEYGVGYKAINKIVQRITWKHVSD